MFRLLVVSFLLLFVSACGSGSKEAQANDFVIKNSQITCDDGGCYGEYFGPEERDGIDVAHRFSNLMCERVGMKLKELYKNGKYNRVRLDEIKMSTTGMGTGQVRYRLEIPFWPLTQKCLSCTAFDHVGGWGHKPALSKRLSELEGELLFDDYLDVSQLYTTPEGLQEYWIQWRHKEVQKGCEY
ncbi:MAG: hypothetical protein ACFHU9_17300 [Fluviicola sp.]